MNTKEYKKNDANLILGVVSGYAVLVSALMLTLSTIIA